ncbi:hypothetical protein ABZ297_41850 [Nonomuraea sp. NPDC005983]|uniref:hypothetical protein n=1 Tax=Nonomuraea sp. NPDC005983 TaxID=3155595 RepID=UPI0033A82D48
MIQKLAQHVDRHPGIRVPLSETTDNLTASRQALKKMMKDANRAPSAAADGEDSANRNVLS